MRKVTIQILLSLFFFLSLNAYSQESITWGGYTISAKSKDKDLFPNFNLLKGKMAPMQYEIVKSIEKPYLLSPRGQVSQVRQKVLLWLLIRRESLGES